MRTRKTLVLALLALGALVACRGSDTPATERTRPHGAVPADSIPRARGPVRTGAEVLRAQGFAMLRGHRVGLIVNHTARTDAGHVIDLVAAAEGVRLVALFGPEHGLRGTSGAGEEIQDGHDAATGVPVFSLYGRTQKPTPEMLRGVDLLVFDIQDVGARFYTYISTLGLAMQAAAEAGIPFVVLDRPNPLGGDYVAGFTLEPAQQSFVGMYPLPIAHGLTVGELARMIVGERWLPGVERLDLRIVPLEGWQRRMRWGDTGLPWLAPSPNIPDAMTAQIYAGACLFEATAASEGRGTEMPFRLLGAADVPGRTLARRMAAAHLPGARFDPARFTPRDMPGRAADPKLEGQRLGGLRVTVQDAHRYLPVETGIYLLDAFYRDAAERNVQGFLARPEWLDRLAGTPRLRSLLEARTPPADIIRAWAPDVEAFRKRRAPYLLYP